MSKLMRGTALALLLAAVACEDSQAPRPVREVRVPVTIEDTTGQPVARAYVLWRLYFPVPSDTIRPFVWGELWTDSIGRAEVFTDSIALAEVDSLVVSYTGPGCVNPPMETEVTTAVAALGDTGLTLVVDSLLPAARLQFGEMCAMGAEGPTPSAPIGDYFWIGIRVDSITGPVFQGRWASVFQSSRGGYQGPVLGAVVGGAVTLTFINELGIGPCDDFQLQGFLRPDSSWGGLAPSAPNDCFAFLRAVDLVAADYLGFIP